MDCVCLVRFLCFRFVIVWTHLRYPTTRTRLDDYKNHLHSDQNHHAPSKWIKSWFFWELLLFILAKGRHFKHKNVQVTLECLCKWFKVVFNFLTSHNNKLPEMGSCKIFNLRSYRKTMSAYFNIIWAEFWFQKIEDGDHPFWLCCSR